MPSRLYEPPTAPRRCEVTRPATCFDHHLSDPSMSRSCAFGTDDPVAPVVDREEGSTLPHRHYAVAPVLGGVELLSAIYRNHRFAPHSQEAAVIGIVEQGRAVVFGAGETLTLEKGSVLVIPPHVLHDSFSLDGADWHYRALYLNTSQLGQLSPGTALGHGVLGTRPFVLRESTVADQVLATHATLRSLADLGEQRVLDELRALIPALEDAAGRTVNAAPDRQHISVGVARVRALLDLDPLPKRTLKDMARLAQLSRFTFAHAFSRAYGIPPHSYALQRRVMAVRELLVAGELVSRAAPQVGFADQSHLTRRFISTVGVTPGEFRRAWRLAQLAASH